MNTDPARPQAPGPRVSGDTCPECGGSVEHGFGLAYGGYGPYWYCVGSDGKDACGWFVKTQEIDP